MYYSQKNTNPDTNKPYPVTGFLFIPGGTDWRITISAIPTPGTLEKKLIK